LKSKKRLQWQKQILKIKAKKQKEKFSQQGGESIASKSFKPWPSEGVQKNEEN
jgi:hypothetical protein